MTYKAGLAKLDAGCLRALAVVSLISVAGTPSQAGTLSEAPIEPPVISPTPVSSGLSHFYGGFSLGYGWGKSDRFGVRNGGTTVDIGDLKIDGAFGGIRGGWRANLPIGEGRSYVYGFELGFDLAGLEDSTTGPAFGRTLGGKSEVTDIFSLRFRSGITNRSGKTLYFGSVGYVNGGVETTLLGAGSGSSSSMEESDRRNGFLLSLGAEHQLSEKWSLTGEYEYVQFQSKVIDFSSALSTKSTPTYGGVRFGLNYKF